MAPQPWPRGTTLIAAGDFDDPASGRDVAGERVRPGLTGEFDFADSLGTAHVRWETGFRRGVTADQTRLLRPVTAFAGKDGLTVLVPDATPVVIVCRSEPGDVPAGQYLRARNPVTWTGRPALACVFPTVTQAHDAWRRTPGLAAFDVAFVPAT